ncbi:hypothetical protein QBC37DRAFT_384512 [Rhypophila decipiens]|uniref:Uncharacterized protein n=1 Tax=Rhypophila decipiens TaxID=261697 RepID=A0AAN6YDX4_9PEZI|nr:hypothetical protein QBC37DRAFT_384512 [Rhypophila decipiens]
MLPKSVLSITTACFLSVGGVIAAEQKQAKYALAHAELSQEAIAARLNATDDDEDDIPSDHIAVRLFAYPDAKGDSVDVRWGDLKDGHCVNLPPKTTALSVSISGAVKCCLLYRSPCPAVPRLPNMHQNPGFFHQKIFSPIRDLFPYGFTDRPRSVVCPSQDLCKAFWQDRNWTPEQLQNVGPYWVDIRSIPDREFI